MRRTVEEVSESVRSRLQERLLDQSAELSFDGAESNSPPQPQLRRRANGGRCDEEDEDGGDGGGEPVDS